MAIINQTITNNTGAGKTAGSNSSYTKVQYPHDLDLTTQPYMVIRINELVNTHFKTSNGSVINSANTRGNSTSGQLAQSNMSNAQAAGITVAGGAAVGLGLGSIGMGMDALFSRSGIMVNSGAMVKDTVIGAAAGGVVAGSYHAVAPQALKQMQRISTEIVLYMPNSLTVPYTMHWEGHETKFLSTATSILNGSPEAQKAVAQSKTKSNGVIDSIKSALTGTGTVGKELSSAGIALTGGVDALNIAAGIAVNPRMEQMFSSVDYRKFDFTFDFAARNADEFDEIVHIIYLLKFHAHPEFASPQEFLYLYPSNFDIRFFLGNDENTYIPRIGTSVITSISADYSPEQVWAQLANGGVPHIKVVVSFTEIGLLDKSTIQAGY